MKTRQLKGPDVGVLPIRYDENFVGKSLSDCDQRLIITGGFQFPCAIASL
jgi:hypothetical protein